VPIPHSLDARVIDGVGRSRIRADSWYHSHMHGRSSDQVMGGCRGCFPSATQRQTWWRARRIQPIRPNALMTRRQPRISRRGPTSAMRCCATSRCKDRRAAGCQHGYAQDRNLGARPQGLGQGRWRVRGVALGRGQLQKDEAKQLRKGIASEIRTTPGFSPSTGSAPTITVEGGRTCCSVSAT
jgi:hypothetical protein